MMSGKTTIQEIVTKLEDLSDGVCSEKVTLRNKAVDQLKQIFDDCRITVQDVLAGKIRSSLTPKFVFTNVFNGMLKHASRQESTQSQKTDNKAPVFITVLQYLIDYCNSIEANRIQSSLIFDSLLRIFEDGFYARQYGTQFLRMLDRYLSSPNHSNFFNIDKGLWKRLLEGCRQMCDDCGEEARSLAILCMAKILELGSTYSYLADNLADYVPFVETLFADLSERHGNLKDLLRIAFLLTRILRVNFQYEMCLFSENIAPFVLRNYNTNMKEDVKSQIFEFLHLIMVIHEPLHENTSHDNYNLTDWSAIKSSIEKVIKMEVTYLNEYKFTRDLGVLPEALLSSASYLFYLLMKPQNVPNEQCPETPRSEKRMRISSLFENMLSLIRPNDKIFNWKWFVILGSVLNQRPLLKEFPESEVAVLVRITTQALDSFTFDIQFKGLYQILQYLIDSGADRVPWREITQGIYKLALKFQSSHSMELLHFVVHNQLCEPKLILEIYKNTMASPAYEMGVKTLSLLFHTKRFREIVREPTMERDLVVEYLNSNGPLVLKQAYFERIVELVLILLNIPERRKDPLFVPRVLTQKTVFELEMEDLLKKLAFKAIVVSKNGTSSNKDCSEEIVVKPEDVNRSLFRSLVKTIFIDTVSDSDTSVAHVAQILLRQLEFATMFLGRISTVMDMSKATILLDKIFVNFESNLSALTVAFKSQISEDNGVINKLLEYLNNLLSVNYLRELKPVLESTGFIAQAAIWTHNQYLEPGDDIRDVVTTDDGKSSLRNPAIRRNALVIENILRLGSIKERILNDHWINIASATNIMVSFHIMKKVSEMSPNKTMAKKIISELEEIFEAHHRNEQVSQMVLRTLTNLLDLFKEHPISASEWDKIVIQCIKWGCKQKYSPQLSICLLTFYERFFESFTEHRGLNPELQDLISQSLPYFIKSKNFDVQMKAIQVVVKILSTNQILHKDLTIHCAIEYCQFANGLVCSLQLEEMLEIETSSCGNDNRLLAKDEFQNHSAVVHQLVTGAAHNNENLAIYFIQFLVKFYHQNHSLAKNKNLSIYGILEQNLSLILEAGIPITSFPHFLVNCNTIEDFILNYQIEIGKSLIKNRPLKEFVDFQKKFALKKIVQELQNVFLIYKILPDHELHKNSNFKANLEKLIPEKDVQTLFRKHDVSLLQNLLSSYWDEAKFVVAFSFQYPQGAELPKDQFAINENELSTAILSLNKLAVSNKGSYIVNCCMKYPQSILMILYFLQGKVQSSPHTFSKLKNLLKVFKFSELVMEFIERPSENSQVDHYKAYFVKNLVRFLLNVVSNECEMVNSIKVLILIKLKELIRGTVTQCSKMYKSNLNCIIRQLVDLVLENDKQREELSKSVVEIITIFMIDCQSVFADVLEEVDILPEDRVEFELLSTNQYQYRKTKIKDEIKRFLDIPGRGVYSLKYLRKRIDDNREEFISLFKESRQEFRCLPNNNNLPLDLVFELLKCVQGSKESVRVEASKILGDIGPVDLNTLVLQDNGNQKDLIVAFSSLSSAIQYSLPAVVKYLEEVLYEYNSEVSSLALKALIEIVFLKESENLLQNRSDLFVFKQVHEDVPVFLQKGYEMTETEVLAGLALDKFSRIKATEYINSNVKLFLMYFNNCSLNPIVEKKPEFGQRIFPFLIIKLMSLKDNHLNVILGKKVNKFFSDFESIREISSTNMDLDDLVLLNQDLLKLMINVVEIIRIYNQCQSLKINLNYLSIAAAAQYCDLHGNAILYGELWVEEEKSSRKCSEMDLPLPGLRSIMIPSYEAMEVPDAVKPFLDLNQSRHKYYMMENAWEFAYLESKAGLRGRNPDPRELNQTRSYCRSQSIEKDSDYEMIWRLSDWDRLKSNAMDCVEATLNLGEEDDFQRLHCLALKCLPWDDLLPAQGFLDQSRNCIIKDIARSSLDSSKAVYQSLTALKQIQQLEDVLAEKTNFQGVLKKWNAFDELQLNSFEQHEQILMQRIFLLQSKQSVPAMEQQMKETVLGLIRLAKEERNFRVAVTSLKSLEAMELNSELRSEMILEDGHLQFIAGHSKLAHHLYLRLIQEEEFKDTFSKIQALRLMTEHLTDSLMVNPNEIFKTYLAPAETLYNVFKKTNSQRTGGISATTIAEEQVKIFDTTAKFADTIYTQRNNYLKSSEYAEKQKLHQESQQEYKTVDKSNLTQHDKMRLHTLRQTIALEEKELRTVSVDRENYLNMAIKLYTKSCTISEDRNDLKICRIVSLWFTNIANEFLMKFMAKNLSAIPSYKFLLILPQIAARLSNSDRTLTEIISNTLIRSCQQHPHHSIYHILALFNAHADNKQAQISSSMKTRIENTKLIMCKLMADKTVGEIVKAAQNLGTALIKLANKDVKDAKDARSTQVSSEVTNLGDMYRIAVPTVDIPVQINGNYKSFPYIVSWVPNFRMMGGINCPKKLNFLCSDGISRSMLAKGKDDLRQDAVMEQVFNFMNILLQTKQSTRKRNLSIRTYKIVPLTQMSGILEFCDNTNTLGNYLLGAHEKYRPMDPPVSECRSLMQHCAKGTPEEKLKQFEGVCKRLKPVFQNFFTENFFTPVEWFEKRMFYINSVATTSMVGYIMGIGDRHVNNILIDKSTAEVIHIDFGIAFERGKLLPTPEKVPFRLTRDLVAAMGCFGVDGTFRTSCEITMQVLRENKALINTIIEVFLYDPLYSWLSNKKRSDDANDDEKNALATRVLIRVNEKLNGRDENDATAIENQVERLIRQATSPSNQAQMFYGWQPYL